MALETVEVMVVLGNPQILLAQQSLGLVAVVAVVLGAVLQVLVALAVAVLVIIKTILLLAQLTLAVAAVERTTLFLVQAVAQVLSFFAIQILLL
jgi:hypothetical protein